MQRLLTFTRLKYLGLALLIALLVASAGVQEYPIALESIAPAEGQPGQELEVSLLGRGFGDASEVFVSIGDLEVWEAWVISDGEIGAVIYIPEDAPPGPRDAEVAVVFGPDEEFSAGLESGFIVLEGEAPPPDETGPEEPPSPDDFVEPPGGPDGTIDRWLLLVLVLLGGTVLFGGSVVIALTLVWRRAVVRQKWQAQATENELPQTCQAGTYIVRREKPRIKPGRWKVTGLKVTVYNAGSGTTDAVHQASAELVKKLDSAARQHLLHGMSESLEQSVEQIGGELTPSMLAWQLNSKAGQDLYLQTWLEGGQAEQKFIRYRCTGSPGGWVKQAEWTLKLKAIDRLPRVVRGPAEGETREKYSAFLKEQAGAYLLEVMEGTGSLF
jgi:hypothetical protein